MVRFLTLVLTSASFMIAIDWREVNGQLTVILNSNAIRDDSSNCDWSDYGDCVWMNGPAGDHTNNWNKNYFDQLNSDCKEATLYKLLRKNFKAVVNNLFGYFRKRIVETSPCGYCSYQQACATNCKYANKLNVSEQLCDQFDQSKACSIEPAFASADCILWPPNDSSLMLGLPHFYRKLITNANYINCASDAIGGGCRCCCAPYRPDDAGNCVEDPDQVIGNDDN